MGKVKYLKKCLAFLCLEHNNIKMEEWKMKELENVMSQLEKETKKKEQADTKRKVEKGGVFEAFEREITGR